MTVQFFQQLIGLYYLYSYVNNSKNDGYDLIETGCEDNVFNVLLPNITESFSKKKNVLHHKASFYRL
jgi:hypothetical protein